MSRLHSLSLCFALVLISPVPGNAQVKDDFVQALVRLANAANGVFGDEGPVVLAAIDEMAEGLAQWDATIGRMESGLQAEIGAAPLPMAARMRTALGAAYLERGRLDEALAQFDTAAKLDPMFGEVHVFRGLAQELANRPMEAAEAWRVAWQKQPENLASAYRARRAGRSVSDTTLVDATTRALATAVELGSVPGEKIAATFVNARLLDEASVSSPVFLPALYSDALTLISDAKYAEAIDALRTAAALDSLVIDRALQSDEVKRGAAESRRQNAPAATTALTTAAGRDPDSAEVHRLLGFALWSERRYPSAIDHLQTAIRLNPRDERARLALADVLFESGNPVGARAVLGELTQAMPRSGQGHWKLGRLHQALGDEAGALRSYEAASTLPHLAGGSQVYTALGRIRHNQLDLDRAASAYQRRVELTPSDAAAHLDLGDVYRAQDRLDDALAEYLVAALLDSTSVRALATAAQIHVAAGRDEAGVTLLRRAVALDSDHLESRYALARALMRLGLTDEARRELERFEQLQQKALQDERRRFQENQIKIDETLKAAEPTR
jgi:tetratricopeptide (TPR) repeat protein